MKNHFVMFAAYNRWANDRIYSTAATLEEEAYRRDVGAFFGSMHGTLNHLLVGDRIWMKRFTGQGEHPARLNAILFEDFAALQEARQAEDRRIKAWVDGLDDAALAGTLAFRTITNPTDVTARLAPTLAHFFNHQTHHRGHAHMILSVLGIDPPSLDLIEFQRTEEGKPFA